MQYISLKPFSTTADSHLYFVSIYDRYDEHSLPCHLLCNALSRLFLTAFYISINFILIIFFAPYLPFFLVHMVRRKKKLVFLTFPVNHVTRKTRKHNIDYDGIWNTQSSDWIPQWPISYASFFLSAWKLRY